MPDLPRPTFKVTLSLRPPEEPNRLRFIERKGRYILQEMVECLSASASLAVRWRDVPLVRNP